MSFLELINVGSDVTMFFAKPGEFAPCGMFTKEHFILLAITVLIIIIALKNTVNKKDTKKIIRKCTIFLWIMEVIIILFKILITKSRNVNDFLPLYYCGIILYAGVCSSLGKNTIERTGNVFLATGAIVGGIIFLIFPTTSLLTYPTIHLVSIHSFIFHGIMMYLGLLVNFSNYIELKNKDIINYASIVGIVCLVAYIVNKQFDSNLMFISKNFSVVPLIKYLYENTGNFFTPLMIISQCTLPFYLIYGMRKNIKK